MGIGETQLPNLIETINNMMSEAVPEIFKKCQEVYMYPLFKIGFSFNLVFDPIVGRAYVATILNSLSFLRLLPIEPLTTNDVFDAYMDLVEYMHSFFRIGFYGQNGIFCFKIYFTWKRLFFREWNGIFVLLKNGPVAFIGFTACNIYSVLYNFYLMLVYVEILCQSWSTSY